MGLFVYSRDWVNPGPAWVERLGSENSHTDRMERMGKATPGAINRSWIGWAIGFMGSGAWVTIAFPRTTASESERKGYEVSVMKVMMDLVGLVEGPVRPPLANLRPEEVTEVKTMLERWSPVLA